MNNEHIFSYHDNGEITKDEQERRKQFLERVLMLALMIKYL